MVAGLPRDTQSFRQCCRTSDASELPGHPHDANNFCSAAHTNGQLPLRSSLDKLQGLMSIQTRGQTLPRPSLLGAIYGQRQIVHRSASPPTAPSAEFVKVVGRCAGTGDTWEMVDPDSLYGKAADLTDSHKVNEPN